MENETLAFGKGFNLCKSSEHWLASNAQNIRRSLYELLGFKYPDELRKSLIQSIRGGGSIHFWNFSLFCINEGGYFGFFLNLD